MSLEECILKKPGDFYSCKICEIIICGSQQVNGHLEGKDHKKRILKQFATVSNL